VFDNQVSIIVAVISKCLLPTSFSFWLPFYLPFLLWGSNESAESILRSRAMMITGRLLSKENAFMFIDESSKRWKLSLSLSLFLSALYPASEAYEFPLIFKMVIVVHGKGISHSRKGPVIALKHFLLLSCCFEVQEIAAYIR
jgi:hypothetical protein